MKRMEESVEEEKKSGKQGKQLKFKLVVDFYNAVDAIEEFKAVSNIVEIHIFNDKKQEGLDQILPLKKKCNKIGGIHNSILSLIIKA